MSDLGSRQEKFATLLPRLLDQARFMGFGVRLGEAWRSDETAKLNAEEGKGIVNSLHRMRLAIDLTLTQGGVVLTDSADYETLGTYWKGLDPGCCWGGDFKDKEGKPKPDGDHFSLTYQGIK